MHPPLLVMLSGLPGCGKSTVANALVQRLSQLNFAIVASDQVRKELFPQPSYSDDESRIAHQTVQERVVSHLLAGRSVIHDATHLQRSHRQWRHEAVRLTGCRAVLLKVWLDETTARERLAARQLNNDGWSDADVRIYKLMKESAESIQSPHLSIQTGDGFANEIGSIAQQLETLHTAAATRVTKRKAFCYITRGAQLLVFEQPNAPEAGIQVPAGTVESGESAETAALREAGEETGLTDLVLADLLGTQTRDMHDFGKNELHHRSFLRLTCTHATPQRWQHWEEFGGDGNRHLFELYWAELDNLPKLIADHDFCIDALC